MPASKPPSGSYTSTVGGDLSSWSGTFSYSASDGAIKYQRTNPAGSYTIQNKSNGNAFAFHIRVSGANPVNFNAPNHTVGPHGKAKYTGTANDNRPGEGEGDWTATQS